MQLTLPGVQSDTKPHSKAVNVQRLVGENKLSFCSTHSLHVFISLEKPEKNDAETEWLCRFGGAYPYCPSYENKIYGGVE